MKMLKLRSRYVNSIKGIGTIKIFDFLARYPQNGRGIIFVIRYYRITI